MSVKEMKTDTSEQIHRINLKRKYCAKPAPGKKCKFGWNCRQISQCSFYHGNGTMLSCDFCDCTSYRCPKPHPNRRRDLVCKKCQGAHSSTKCPFVMCSYCKRWDSHTAANCNFRLSSIDPSYDIA